MKTTISERYLEAVFSYVCVLPLTLTGESSSRWIRFAGLLWYVVWFFPAGVLSAPFMILGLLAVLIEETWRG